jgi:hypothetical protein
MSPRLRVSTKLENWSFFCENKNRIANPYRLWDETKALTSDYGLMVEEANIECVEHLVFDGIGLQVCRHYHLRLQ